MNPRVLQLGLGGILAGGLLVAVFGGGPPARAAEGPDAYGREVRPLLARYCFGCHGENKPKGGLNLAAFTGGEKAPRPLPPHSSTMR